jgi:hypothetical protein
MQRINCHIPIKLRITGRPTDTQLDQLGETLVHTLQARVAFAERTIAEGRPISVTSVVEEVREPLAEERIHETDYEIPTYQGESRRKRVRVHRVPTHQEIAGSMGLTVDQFEARIRWLRAELARVGVRVTLMADASGHQTICRIAPYPLPPHELEVALPDLLRELQNLAFYWEMPPPWTETVSQEEHLEQQLEPWVPFMMREKLKLLVASGLLERARREKLLPIARSYSNALDEPWGRFVLWIGYWSQRYHLQYYAEMPEELNYWVKLASGDRQVGRSFQSAATLFNLSMGLWVLREFKSPEKARDLWRKDVQERVWMVAGLGYFFADLNPSNVMSFAGKVRGHPSGGLTALGPAVRKLTAWLKPVLHRLDVITRRLRWLRRLLPEITSAERMRRAVEKIEKLEESVRAATSRAANVRRSALDALEEGNEELAKRQIGKLETDVRDLETRVRAYEKEIGPVSEELATADEASEAFRKQMRPSGKTPVKHKMPAPARAKGFDRVNESTKQWLRNIGDDVWNAAQKSLPRAGDDITNAFNRLKGVSGFDEVVKDYLIRGKNKQKGARFVMRFVNRLVKANPDITKRMNFEVSRAFVPGGKPSRVTDVLIGKVRFEFKSWSRETFSRKNLRWQFIKDIAHFNNPKNVRWVFDSRSLGMSQKEVVEAIRRSLTSDPSFVRKYPGLQKWLEALHEIIKVQ